MKPTDEERKYLIDVYNDTVKYIPTLGITNNILIDNTKYYNGRNTIEFIPKQFNTQITFSLQDTFEAAKELGPDCAVLNMASIFTPGGGVRKGSKAQEECLCRRSNLIISLMKYDYPIWGSTTIFSPNVTVFKDSNYNYIQPYNCHVLTAAMLKDPELSNGHFNKEDLKKVVNKIETLLDVALTNDVRKVVLGAWGCGAYHCPPKDVASAFKFVINEPRYKNQFEEIRFAILANTSLILNNYTIFKDVFDDPNL